MSRVFIGAEIYGCLISLWTKCAFAVLNPWLSADPNIMETSEKETVTWWYVTTYPIVIIFFLEKYSADEKLAKSKSEITRFAHRTGTNSWQHTEQLVANVLCCGDVCEKDDLNDIFIEKIGPFIQKICANTAAPKRRHQYTTSNSTQFCCRGCNADTYCPKGQNSIRGAELDEESRPTRQSHCEWDHGQTCRTRVQCNLRFTDRFDAILGNICIGDQLKRDSERRSIVANCELVFVVTDIQRFFFNIALLEDPRDISMTVHIE